MIMIDMDIPDNCDECRFNTEYGFCKAMPDNFCGNTDDRKRPEWCPLKEQEVIKPKTIPEELKLKMWNALYTRENKFEEKYIGTKEQNSWFFIYRSWLQEGFNLAIKAITDWEGG